MKMHVRSVSAHAGSFKVTVGWADGRLMDMREQVRMLEVVARLRGLIARELEKTDVLEESLRMDGKGGER